VRSNPGLRFLSSTKLSFKAWVITHTTRFALTAITNFHTPQRNEGLSLALTHKLQRDFQLMLERITLQQKLKTISHKNFQWVILTDDFADQNAADIYEIFAPSKTKIIYVATGAYTKLFHFGFDEVWERSEILMAREKRSFG
jgi:hypothetical protein